MISNRGVVILSNASQTVSASGACLLFAAHLNDRWAEGICAHRGRFVRYRFGDRYGRL